MPIRKKQAFTLRIHGKYFSTYPVGNMVKNIPWNETPVARICGIVMLNRSNSAATTIAQLTGL